MDLAGAGVGVVTEKDSDVPELLQLLQRIRPECPEAIARKVQHLQLAHAGEGPAVDGYQRVVSEEELLQAGKVGEHARGQQAEVVPREVEAEEPPEASPAQSRGEVCQGGEVVQRAAQVELLKGAAGYAESLRVDEDQLVPAEVQEAQVEEGREAVGCHLCYPVKRTKHCNVCDISYCFHASHCSKEKNTGREMDIVYAFIRYTSRKLVISSKYGLICMNETKTNTDILTYYCLK